MAKIVSLYDRESGERQYPITSTRAVLNEQGADVDGLFAQEARQREAAITAALKGYATTTDLATKQPKLTPSADFLLTPGGILSLTEKAKRALFVDLWNQACGKWGRYNEQTGFFELNGITDITYEEALKIYNYSTVHGGYVFALDSCYAGTSWPSRTYLPFKTGDTQSRNFRYAFWMNKTVEVITFTSTVKADISEAFRGAEKLRTINGTLWSITINSLTFAQCYALEDVIISTSATSIYLQWSPNLSLKSLDWIAGRIAGGTAVLTHYVHPEVYAKLTDPDNAEWYAVMQKAQKNNISFAAKEPT